MPFHAVPQESVTVLMPFMHTLSLRAKWAAQLGLRLCATGRSPVRGLQELDTAVFANLPSSAWLTMHANQLGANLS